MAAGWRVAMVGTVIGWAVAATSAEPPRLVPGHQTQSVDAHIEFTIRVFNGEEEVTHETRVRIYPTGVRETPIPVESDRAVARVAPGIYDVQAIQQRQGSVVNIRWAERLVVMRYPDEGGRHLEVINFKSGYGALQLRPGESDAALEGEITAYAAGDRASPRKPHRQGGYALFVLPAGKYDIRIARAATPGRSPEKEQWMEGIEIPLDRTRLRLVP